MERDARCVLFNNRDLQRWNSESGFIEFGFVRDDVWSDGYRYALFLLFDRLSLLEWDVRYGKRRFRPDPGGELARVRERVFSDRAGGWFVHDLGQV